MNDFKYIKFEYVSKKSESYQPESIFDKLEKLIRQFSIIPIANPDFEQLLEKVTTWKIEFNTKKRFVNREIGFDVKGKLIVAMPIKKNYGFWIDTQMQLDDFERFAPIEIEKEKFENDWKDAIYRFGN